MSVSLSVSLNITSLLQGCAKEISKSVLDPAPILYTVMSGRLPDVISMVRFSLVMYLKTA